MTKATLKGLALANFMFVYLLFYVCRDGFVNLTRVRMKRVFKCASVYVGVSCPNVTV